MKTNKILNLFFILSLLFCFLGPISVFAKTDSEDPKNDPKGTEDPKKSEQQHQPQPSSSASPLFENAKYEEFEEQEDTDEEVETIDRTKLEPQ